MLVRGAIMDPETLGLFLQQARMARGLSQRELARELGISQRWVSEMETGKPGKLMARLFAMLHATGVELHGQFEADDG